MHKLDSRPNGRRLASGGEGHIEQHGPYHNGGGWPAVNIVERPPLPSRLPIRCYAEWVWVRGCLSFVSLPLLLCALGCELCQGFTHSWSVTVPFLKAIRVERKCGF